MIVVGLTGGIGSGKSYVARIFEALGVPVYRADDDAKRAYEDDEELKRDLIREFGRDLYVDGKFQPARLSKIVFNDPEALNRLNTMVHPVVARRFENWLRRQDHPYVLKEAAILFESGAHKGVKMIIGVIAGEETRLERAMERDDVGRGEVLKRMARQWSPDTYIDRCDYVIENDGNTMLLPQILQIDEDLKRRADQRS